MLPLCKKIYWMKFYFLLTFKRIHRIIAQLGFHPFILYGLAPIIFVSLSFYMIQNVPYWQYIYTSIAFILIYSVANKERVDFIKSQFSAYYFRLIRITENLLISIPFFLFLVYKEEYISSLATIVGSIILSFQSNSSPTNFTLPTPFTKNPFEFIIGFRKTILIILASHALSIVAIKVGNFNLLLFSLIVTFISSLSFYSRPEPIEYVWVYSKNTQQFLYHKMRLATKQIVLLTSPLFLTMLLLYPENWIFIAATELLGILFLNTNLLGKYSNYPTEINLVQGMAIAISFLFPPILLILIPTFYKQSKKTLHTILK